MVKYFSMKTTIPSVFFLAFLSANPVGAVPPQVPSQPAPNPSPDAPLQVLDSKVITGTCKQVPKSYSPRTNSECRSTADSKSNRWMVYCHQNFPCTRNGNPCTIHLVTTKAKGVTIDGEALCQ
ncbi:hypothetical protein BDV32DRAFT_126930 [Aspergillus pseudonomiae]|nr:hypothetical protein BDV32DRAFT_126930 [Aspergillus pseudonomiae]